MPPLPCPPSLPLCNRKATPCGPTSCLALIIHLLWVRWLLLALVNLKIVLSAEGHGNYSQLQASLRKPTGRLEGQKMRCGSACFCPLVYMVLLGKNALFQATVEQEVSERRWGLKLGYEVCLGLSGCSCVPWGHCTSVGWHWLPPSAERELLTLLVQNISAIRYKEVYSGSICISLLVSRVVTTWCHFFVVFLRTIPLFSCFALLAVLSNPFGMTYTCCVGT